MPKVSVVMAVYNGDAYLGDAIQSILSQSFIDFEFIIIDDGSTDNSAEIICSYGDPRIRLLRQENRGLAASLNLGIKLSKGEYIARMDADDISEPSRLKLQVQFMDDNPDCVLIGTWALMIDKDGQPLRVLKMPRKQVAIRRELERYACPFIHGSVMFRKVAGLQCGFYDRRMITGEDWLLWTKMFYTGRMGNLPDVLYRRRLTPEATTTATPRMVKLKMAILERVRKTGAPTAEDSEQLRLLTKGISIRPQERRAHYHLKAGKALIEGNWQPVRARRHMWKSLCCYPYNIIAWINLAFCFLPRKWVGIWKRWRTKESCS